MVYLFYAKSVQLRLRGASNPCLPKAGALALPFTANETRCAPHAGSLAVYALLFPVIALQGVARSYPRFSFPSPAKPAPQLPSL
jgi:hypothetical protein